MCNRKFNFRPKISLGEEWIKGIITYLHVTTYFFTKEDTVYIFMYIKIHSANNIQGPYSSLFTQFILHVQKKYVDTHTHTQEPREALIAGLYMWVRGMGGAGSHVL